MSADLQGICIWYAAGWCRYGADCRYSHNREQISKKEKKWLQERVGAEPAPKLTENQQKWQIAHVDDFDDDMGQFDPIKSLFDGIEEVNLHNNVGFEEERDRGEDENSHDDTEEEEEDHTLRNKANPLTLGDDDDDDDDDLFSTAPCSSSSTASPHVEYLFILDFEGGGTDTYGADEIIEVPVSLFHVSTLQEISRFHSFVRPRAWSSPQLQKEMGEAGTSHSSNSLSGLLVPEWPQVLQMMESWARENGIHLRDPKEHPASPESSGNSNQKIADTPSPSSSSPSHSPSSPPSVSSLPPPSLSSPSYCFLTCGNWDLGTMVPKQCTRSEIEPPHYFNEWINLKELFNKYYSPRREVRGMAPMLKYLGIPLTGIHHLGMDDVTNITKIVKHMLVELAEDAADGVQCSTVFMPTTVTQRLAHHREGVHVHGHR